MIDIDEFLECLPEIHRGRSQFEGVVLKQVVWAMDSQVNAIFKTYSKQKIRIF